MAEAKSGVRRPPRDAKLEQHYGEVACRGVLGAARLVNHPLKRVGATKPSFGPAPSLVLKKA